MTTEWKRKMKTGMDLLAEKGVDTKQKHISEEDFANAGLPMIVSCYNCTMTIALPTALIDDDGKIYCSGECGGIDEDGDY